MWGVTTYPYEIPGQLVDMWGLMLFHPTRALVGDKSGKTASHSRMPMKDAVDNAVCGRAVSCCEMMLYFHDFHDVGTVLLRLAGSCQPPTFH